MNEKRKLRPVLQLQNVAKKYGDDQALAAVSLDVYPGEILSVIGPNGAGKTTLLQIAAGYMTADEGRVFLYDKDRTNQLNVLNRHVAVVFGGSRGFYRNSSVLSNLVFFATLMGIPQKERKSRIEKVLGDTALLEHADKKVSALSMGLLQRLHIARGLLKETPVLLLDEPTNGVDAKTAVAIRQLIKKIALGGRAIILTSHQLHEVSDLADRIQLLYQGHFSFEGSVAELAEASGLKRIDRPATLEESYLALIDQLGG
ncbi:ABC transporter ATP-binding protein [Fructobacillus sp. M1-13]|uniref:ABC transporter ATP-binding protein n=1 Tax=Fructobacillus papyriferae TaxID=2713171 RepID=A0ABS5QPN2_9LACO|nr:ABC transporter ATP-binding protein [Fructobacillus papyriferae]MBS9335055.1 ABC transporter ATP-binding protein [Fructobacillus papyriferae]MCD2159459.1 ABC transporter ATP-binding protein [Fructobacillus papyriferae]